MNKRTTYVLVELLVYTTLFVLSLLCFPICNYYFEDTEDILTKPQYVFDLGAGFVFPLYFAMAIVGFLSLKKTLIIVINSSVFVLQLLTYLFISLGFAWWGASPFHPDFQLGYWISQLITLLLISRTSYLIIHLSELHLNRNLTRLFSLLAVISPLALITYFLLLVRTETQQPMIDSEWVYIEGNRSVKSQGWDYTEAYGARVKKYFSTDTLEQAPYQLDSVEFTFYGDYPKIRKKFTKQASNGELNIEEILERYD